MHIDSWATAFLALFAILNPLGLIPIFTDFTEGLERADRLKVTNVAVLTGFSTMTVMTFLGGWLIKNLFQIDIVEFRIAGGILLTVIAVRYIVFPPKEGLGGKTAEEVREKALESSIVPMGVPLLVGPGSIVTGILIMGENGFVITLTALVTAFLACWIIFLLSPLISRMMGKVGRLVISRVLWIFIAAIGVHLLLTGIRDMFGI